MFWCPNQNAWLRVDETKETVQGRYQSESAALGDSKSPHLGIGQVKLGEVTEWHRPIQNYQLKLSPE